MTRSRGSLPLLAFATLAGCSSSSSSSHDAGGFNFGDGGATSASASASHSSHGATSTSSVAGSSASAGSSGSSSGASSGSSSAVGSSSTSSLASGTLATVPMGASFVSGALAIDATYVYWATTNNANVGTIWKTPIGGGQSSTIASGMLNPTVLAVSSSDVYWCDSRVAHDVVSASLAGGATTTLFSGMPVYDLAVGPSAAYFWVVPTSGPTQLTQTSLDGGTPSTLATAPVEGPLAIGGSNLYWADQNGDVGAVPLAGGSAMTLVTGSASNYVEGNIAVDGTSVYWSQNDIDTGNGALLSVPLAGGTPTTVTSGPEVAGLAVDSTTIYFTSNDSATGTGALATVPLGGGTVTTLSIATSGMNGVVVDGTSVYWTNVTTGILAKMPK